MSLACASPQDLADLISTVYCALPAVLNVYLPDIPFPTHAWGRLGKSEFRWTFESSGVHGLATVTSKTNQERLITNSWRLIAVVANSRRLMGGLHYFHVACRLLTGGLTVSSLRRRRCLILRKAFNQHSESPGTRYGRNLRSSRFLVKPRLNSETSMRDF